MSFGRDTPLGTAQSSWSKVLISGKRASRSSRARSALMPIGDLGFEQFAQQVFVSPAAVAGAPA
jgi:hypothetical protein